jgi:hypothetical protein
MNTTAMIKFYNQYRADQQDGFVSNIDSYVKHKLKGCSPQEIQEVITRLNERIKKETYNNKCKVK